MPNTEAKSGIAGLWARLVGSLSGKLLVLLVSSMALAFGVLGYVDIQLHRRHLERTALADAARMSSVIKRNTSYYMLRNQRDGLYHIITDMANEPGMVRIRIINDRGSISFSSDPSEMGKIVDQSLQVHDALPATVSSYRYGNGKQSFRTYSLPSGERALGVITPIENSPSCSAAECHAHPAEIKTLGVLDTNISLASTDQSVAESRRQVLLYTVLAILGVAVLIVAFVEHMVGEPLKALTEGTHRLGSGDLGYQIHLKSSGELQELATSFNTMSCQLDEAHSEINAWTRTLEERVEQKTRELSGAREEMLRVERMASIGKLAAVVAHEINNPLAGILTYAKLLKKRLSRGPEPNAENINMLDLVESESRRCGEIVKNLMTFARPTSMNREPANLNTVIDRCLRLVQHQLELKNIELHKPLQADLPLVRCDAGQIEQVVLALVMNAIDAMPNGGNLTVTSRGGPDARHVQIEVRDDGVGMPPDVLSNMFEPFFTTKERGRGLGLGLAISRNIVDRHGGRIEVASQPGRGTTFTITLPLKSNVVLTASPVGAAG
ncbi:MAG TPA: ATP-binding protein [Candidatus Sulfotelmatobacter sp.]|nr:ATP-binding protein [Candidatus Sulfotelmatobacter sp.]